MGSVSHRMGSVSHRMVDARVRVCERVRTDAPLAEALLKLGGVSQVREPHEKRESEERGEGLREREPSIRGCTHALRKECSCWCEDADSVSLRKVTDSGSRTFPKLQLACFMYSHASFDW
eukprot:2545093-Pleurochrysis_carterae.AAC.1